MALRGRQIWMDAERTTGTNLTQGVSMHSVWTTAFTLGVAEVGGLGPGL